MATCFQINPDQREGFVVSPVPSGLFILIMSQMKMSLAGHPQNCIAIKSKAMLWLDGTEQKNKVSRGISKNYERLLS